MTITITEIIRPRIYVACLASYNAGILHGAWIDATGGAWAIWEGIRDMLAHSPEPGAEEFSIHDHEGFEGARIAEFEDIESVAEIAAFILEHGKLGAELIAYHDGDMVEAREAIESRYLGRYASAADYLQECMEGANAVPDALRFYIDWEAIARDAELSGDLFTLTTGYDVVHVFAAR